MKIIPVIVALGLAACSKPVPERTAPTTDVATSAPTGDSNSRSSEGMSNVAPIANVNFEFEDLTSDIGPTPLLLNVAGRGYNLVDAAILSDIASAVTLKTYPEMIEEPVDVIVHPGRLPERAPEVPKGQVAPPAQVAVRDSIEIKPRAPLGKRWHVLAVSRLPSGVAAPSESVTSRGRPLGKYGVRFRPDSAPVLRKISLCEKTSASRLVFSFSEGVESSTAGQFTAVETQRGTACTAPVLTGQNLNGQDNQFMDCGDTLWANGKVHFEMRPGREGGGTKSRVGVPNDNATNSDEVAQHVGVVRDLDFSSDVAVAGCKEKYIGM